VKKLTLILACGAGFLCAQETKSVPETKPAVKKTPAASQNGLMVSKDPVTGELRAPTAAESQALTNQPQSLLSVDAPVQIIQNPNGSLTAILGPAQMTYSVVKKGPDGTITMECVSGEKKAAAFLNLSNAPVDLSNKRVAKEPRDEK